MRRSLSQIFCVLLLAAAMLTCSVPASAHPPQDYEAALRHLRKLWMNWGHPGQPPFPSEPAPDAEDAAARYLWLWPRMSPELARLAGYIDTDATGFAVWENDHGVTPEQVRDLLIAEQPWIEQVIAAAGLPHCNFHMCPTERCWPFDEHDPRAKVLLTAPRRCARILAADAHRLLAEGDSAAALARAAAIVRLARHMVQHDGPLLAHLVADFKIRMGMASIERIAPTLAQDQLVALAALLEEIDPRDPVGLRACWNRFRQENAEFVRSQIGDELGWRLLRELGMVHSMRALVDGMFERVAEGGDFLPDKRENWSIARAVFGDIATLTPEQCRAALTIAESLGDALDKAWDAPDADARLRASRDVLNADQTGIVSLILTYPSSIYRDWSETTTKLQELRVALRERLQAPG